MGIVSFGRSATVSTFVTSLALIVLSFTLSEQCIQPVFDRTYKLVGYEDGELFSKFFYGDFC